MRNLVIGLLFGSVATTIVLLSVVQQSETIAYQKGKYAAIDSITKLDTAFINHSEITANKADNK